MTEEMIKECKNCDALGIDSEIGVYYCCLSHRQDDLPKEFTCNDFTPNKQLKRLEQENKELKERFEKRGELMCNCAKQRENYRSVLEEIKEELCYGRTFYEGYFDSKNLSRTDKVIKKINEVLQ